MEDLKKIDEFLTRVKALKVEPIPVTQRQAAKIMDCSTRTVREYAARYNVPMFRDLNGKWHYHLHGVKKMILAKEYNDVIRRFKKKSKAGCYEKRK